MTETDGMLLKGRLWCEFVPGAGDGVTAIIYAQPTTTDEQIEAAKKDARARRDVTLFRVRRLGQDNDGDVGPA